VKITSYIGPTGVRVLLNKVMPDTLNSCKLRARFLFKDSIFSTSSFRWDDERNRPRVIWLLNGRVSAGIPIVISDSSNSLEG